jgi:hypothetical protein
MDPMHFDQPWSVRSKPETRTYPESNGKLNVRDEKSKTGAS